MELDGLQKTSKDLSTRPHLNSFFNDLINIYNIRAPFYYTEGNKIEIRENRDFPVFTCGRELIFI